MLVENDKVAQNEKKEQEQKWDFLWYLYRGLYIIWWIYEMANYK